MKNLLFLLIFLPLNSFSQWSWHEQYPYMTYLQFDTDRHLEYMYLDTIQNPNNIWQIGKPSKTIFNSAYSGEKAIVTDTINSYPINDTSSFIIWHEAHYGFSDLGGGVTCFLRGYYKVNSDTLNDYGKIEFSPDNGISWVLISEDTLEFNLGSTNHTWPINGCSNCNFTGNNSDGWQFFNIDLDYINTVFNLNFGDTVLFRFTFISDGNPETMDGLMFDDIMLTDWYAFNIEENKFSNHKTYPNPVQDIFTIEFTENQNEPFQIQVFDVTGKLVLDNHYEATQKVELNCQELNNGMYFYTITQNNGLNLGNGKILINTQNTKY